MDFHCSKVLSQIFLQLQSWWYDFQLASSLLDLGRQLTGGMFLALERQKKRRDVFSHYHALPREIFAWISLSLVLLWGHPSVALGMWYSQYFTSFFYTTDS